MSLDDPRPWPYAPPICPDALASCVLYALQVRRRCEELARQLEEQGDEMAALQGEMMAHSGEARVVDALRRKMVKLEEASGVEIDKLTRALDKHKREIVSLNGELTRSRREEERLRRHVRQLEAEVKTFQRRAAASSRARPAERDRYGSRERSVSADGSRVGLSPGQQLPGRTPVAARSTASSRASSVNSSTAASRAGSVTHGSRGGSRASSHAASRSASADRSRASSADRSRPSSSRASSTEHSRPPSRDSRSGGYRSKSADEKRRAPAPPSLERAAREALLQTAMQRRSKGLAPLRGSAQNRAPPPARSSLYVASAKAAANGAAPRTSSANRRAGSDGGYSSDEWAHHGGSRSTSLRPPSAGRAKENRAKQTARPLSNSKRAPSAEKSRRPALEEEGVSERGHHVRIPAAMMTYDASDDIKDIDRRLDALQQFLSAAKAPR